MLVPYSTQFTNYNRAYRWTGLQITNKIQRAVIQTIAYSAVFNYPLTAQEIKQYLISELEIGDSLNQLLNSNSIEHKNGYYFLPGFESSVAQREKRKPIAANKRVMLNRFIALAMCIPTIKLIGISGALAMENAHKEDDIDLFIVTTSGTTWLTRMLCILLAEGLGQRRRPKATDVQNKLCLNMFIDEAHLAIPKAERDLFSAHEVVQLKPVYNKEHTYEKFLLVNSWVSAYLPNASNSTKFGPSALHRVRPSLALVIFAEQVARFFQRIYMKGRVTHEVLEDGYLRFHPSDARRFVFGRFEQILQKAILL
ncbi:hypothetical protein COW99_05530 [Candidatus Roizmanbacteria bacterium CG22_combo_CG10-13_8_21_14_all_38_20]|uniref:Polymerase nucleotidyl transferase domain-containing protein n=1 Tax=Candidatus Roizmanbacteria bacterium CG22_combo_CG10-13_8_21_14_all_38_20 TaxID=1974862 RepID=A0A2H0BW74_9BACT|nr:hypothetical protein [Candidatus Microgenomates bacterium]PIP61218.1 MAG: hypothetical protein COW99_05530 [Candidatus Roizmanbacteria bacterium CG22_combo_CG10-13_8_21_14_all_38_20]PJC31208.1 MAG: hypothetical protein CO050_04190 [Candidatus Roizmanbacteria bacterium CG_4_9_14_0_2_um_filter_38_17]